MTERELLKLVCKANRAVRQGDPLKDFLDDEQIIEALQLLEALVTRLSP